MKRRAVHDAARRRGGVADRGARAAGRAHAAHRRADVHGRGRSARPGPLRGVRTGFAGIGLDHRPQRANRLSLGCQQSRQHAQIRGGIGRARAGRDAGERHHSTGGCTTDKPAPSRSCSSMSSIRSAAVLSKAWRGRAATPPASSCSSTATSGKWLELLKEIAPRVTRAAVLRDPATAGGSGQLGAIQSAASQLGVEFQPGRRARRQRDRARHNRFRARDRMAA